MSKAAVVAVLGAGGLIGSAIAEDLLKDGRRVVAVARRFTSAQRSLFGAAACEAPFGTFDADALQRLLVERDVDIVVNCVGVLQDGPRGRSHEAHVRFVATLITALRTQPKPLGLLHLSVPGRPGEDRTDFSRTKREAEALIRGSGLPFAILRPGFVVAPAAYGGSALMRALSASPFALPQSIEARPLAVAAIADICATVRWACDQPAPGWPDAGYGWDILEARASTVGDVSAAFRARVGGPSPRVRLPRWLLAAGAAAGDLAGWLGWSAPLRSTALAEMVRGVEGDPGAWTAATGIPPSPLHEAVAALPLAVQETWFARLYLAKPLVVATLGVFWLASGAVALGPGRLAADALLSAHGVALGWTDAVTNATASADIGVGVALAFRRTCRIGLLASLALMGAYVGAATLIAPELWADPLGPLVKVAPAFVLTLVALAILPDR
jgi:uncharacterized protein YbjT (DUF2867 family)